MDESSLSIGRVKVLFIGTNASSRAPLLKLEGAAGEFKGALGSCLRLMSSPDKIEIWLGIAGQVRFQPL